MEHLPQNIYLIMVLIDVLHSAYKDGQAAPAYNVWRSLLDTGITFALFVWGGFFDTFGLPQIIWSAMTILGINIIIGKRGQDRPNYDVGLTVVANLVVIVLLFWGGFFGQAA